LDPPADNKKVGQKRRENYDETQDVNTVENEKKEVTKIKNFEHTNGNMLLQGSENGRGWTMVISEETGKVSATVSDDQVGFVIFGASTKF
jgi:hypothetical protein